MDAPAALLAIQELMDGVEWNSETADAIAKIMVEAGYRIRDLNDQDLQILGPEMVNVCTDFDMNDTILNHPKSDILRTVAEARGIPVIDIPMSKLEDPSTVLIIDKVGVNMDVLYEALTGLKQNVAAATASEPAQDHERIWLQNEKDGEASGEGRMWCEDKVWPETELCGEPTEYVRADLVIRKDQIDLTKLPEISSFAISEPGGLDIVVEGNSRFLHEHEFIRFHEWTKALFYQHGVEQTVTQQLQGSVADLTTKNEDLVAKLQSLVNDIKTMQHVGMDGRTNWFGDFSNAQDNNGETDPVSVEWPNLAITCEEAEKLLKET